MKNFINKISIICIVVVTIMCTLFVKGKYDESVVAKADAMHTAYIQKNVNTKILNQRYVSDQQSKMDLPKFLLTKLQEKAFGKSNPILF